ncbi:MAG: hypothetical protein QOI10_4270, partial [Solirubrobacterales bacterium]|nr:hypothetical protein [Solirubrobacterales bacterium]
MPGDEIGGDRGHQRDTPASERRDRVKGEFEGLVVVELLHGRAHRVELPLQQHDIGQMRMVQAVGVRLQRGHALLLK